MNKTKNAIKFIFVFFGLKIAFFYATNTEIAHNKRDFGDFACKKTKKGVNFNQHII